MDQSNTLSIDPRIKNLSYSGFQNLHACPRRFQLDKLNAAVEKSESQSESLTFLYGHIVGEGIQDIFLGLSEPQVIFNAFLHWKLDLFDANDKQNKSFWTALTAIQQFYRIAKTGAFKDYELVYYNEIPAIEFAFRVDLGDGFYLRGFVDVILRHIPTKKIVVLEIKTSSAVNLNPATYKNSSQALGYSVVLDKLFPLLSSYEVIYFVWLTKKLTYERFDFTKSYVQRALWIREILLEKEKILLYENAGVYPMHGESCFDFYRECQYLNICTMSTSRLIKPLDALTLEDLEKLKEDDGRYMIELTVQDLIDVQLKKSEVHIPEVIEYINTTKDIIL